MICSSTGYCIIYVFSPFVSTAIISLISVRLEPNRSNDNVDIKNIQESFTSLSKQYSTSSGWNFRFHNRRKDNTGPCKWNSKKREESIFIRGLRCKSNRNQSKRNLNLLNLLGLLVQTWRGWHHDDGIFQRDHISGWINPSSSPAPSVLLPRRQIERRVCPHIVAVTLISRLLRAL